MRKYLRLTEYVWLTMAVMCVGITIYLFVIGANEDGGFASLVSSFAIVMYLMRRRFNRILQRADEKENRKNDIS
ncbi:MAG: hypothetical protein HY064_07920 [Bacteroidetes bacterium]|nr:hypothetical protein [Bacteroidota bacterium]